MLIPDDFAQSLEFGIIGIENASFLQEGLKLQFDGANGITLWYGFRIIGFLP